MLVELFNTGTKKIQEFLNTRFTIYEKLDMYYFKVRIDAAGATPVKISDNSDITVEDAVTNMLFQPVLEFCSKIQDKSNELYITLGGCTVGMFYCPDAAKMHIQYNEKIAGKFVFSDIYTDRYDFNSKEIFKMSFKDLFDAGIILNEPVIAETGPIKDSSSIAELLLKMTDKDRYTYIFDNWCGSTWSNNSKVYISGLILRNGKRTYKISNPYLNTPGADNPDYDSMSKRLWKDMLLKDFITVIRKTYGDRFNGDILSGKTYFEKICRLFVDYMNNTDFFNKYRIDEDDLLPTWDRWLLDFNLEKIPNLTAKTICTINPIAKSVLRLLLHTFKSKFTAGKYCELTADDIKYLDTVFDAVNP